MNLQIDDVTLMAAVASVACSAVFLILAGVWRLLETFKRDLSARLGWLGAAELGRVQRLFERARLPVAPPAGLGADDFLNLMAVDKKASEGRIRLVLLEGLGNAVVRGDTPPALLRATLDACCR